MSMALDSAAVFAERLATLGFQHAAPKFAAAGLSTLGDLAFCSDFKPGGDASAFTATVVTPILGDQPSLGDVSKLRRLYYEAFSVAAADMEHKAGGSSDSAPRTVPAAELEARRERVAAALPSLRLVGALDVSDALLQRCLNIVDSKAFRYVPWAVCTTRDAEVDDSTGPRIPGLLQKDRKGYFREAPAEPTLKANLGDA